MQAITCYHWPIKLHVFDAHMKNISKARRGKAHIVQDIAL